MAEKRNITKDDIFLEARLLSEGVRIETKTPAEEPAAFPGTIIIAGCEITALIRPNAYAPLQAVIEDDQVTISDMSEVLATATFEQRPDWFDIPLRNGNPAWTAVLGMTPDLIAIITDDLCYNQASGQGCKYCGLFRPGDRPAESDDWGRSANARLQTRGELAAEAIKQGT